MSCRPYRVQGTNGALVRAFACGDASEWLCECMVNAIQFAREHTAKTGRAVFVASAEDKEVARTGPARKRDSEAPTDHFDRRGKRPPSRPTS